MPEKTFFTWREFDKAVLNIASQAVRNGYHFDGIFGLARGGLPLAVALSHAMGLPLLAAPTKQSLVVDDIADTGFTLEGYQKRGFIVATILYKRHTSCVIPNIYYRAIESSDWIVFPWEAQGADRGAIEAQVVCRMLYDKVRESRDKDVADLASRLKARVEEL